MIEQLFGSKTRVKLLELFYSNPNRPFYVREITRKIDEQINSVRRELANLLNIGIIVSENTNNRLYYEVNQSFEFYAPLSEIFGGGAGSTRSAATTATTASGTSYDEELKQLGNVELAIFTGQFTRDESTGIDFLLVGNLNEHQVNKYISELEAREGRDVRYTVMSYADFMYRQNIKDRFVATIMLAKKQVLIDKHNIFAQS